MSTAAAWLNEVQFEVNKTPDETHQTALELNRNQHED